MGCYDVYMKFRVTYHARIRLEERGVSLDSVKSIIRKPRTTEIQDGSTIVTGLAHGHTLCVVYVYEKGEYLIITAYYED